MIAAVAMHLVSPPPALADWECWGEEMPLTNEMRIDYEKRFGACTVKPDRKSEVESIVTRIMKSHSRYEAVSARTKVPWAVIAVIHNMECGGRFDCHLHNGNPLTRRTVDVPKGRPDKGHPPFTWEESAVDAVVYEGFDVWRDWTVAGTLYKLELYNGVGYRQHNVPTPYLWAGSQEDLNHDGRIDELEAQHGYLKGKFTSDHGFDPNVVSRQIGAAVLLRRMVDQHLVEIQGAAQ